MSYQECRYKDNVEKIPTRDIDGQSYIFLDDVRDRFPDIQSFTYDDQPIPFENDTNHVRLNPWRIRAFTGKVIECHKPIYDDKVVPWVHDDRQQQFTQIDNKLEQILENTEILKEKADAILRQAFELSEFTVPRLFIVLPEYIPHYNPAHWLHLNYRLYFLCECENGNRPHLAFHEGYEIKQPREFFRKYGPYLHKMLTVAKYAIPACTLIVPHLTHISSQISNSVIPHLPHISSEISNSVIPHLTHISSEISNSVIAKDRMFGNNLRSRIEWLDKILTKTQQSENISTEKKVQHREGVELREIQNFLKKVDAHQTLGNLFRSVTKDGHVRWVCIQHYEQCYSDNTIKDLHVEFQNLGGQIIRDTAVIDKEASNNFSKILSVLKKGLRVCSIILKNLNIKGKDFDELLSYVSKQLVICNLEIENITVLSHPFNMKKRIILSKLHDTLQENDKLNIQYSFTESLSKFVSIQKHTTTKANSRLIFRVRSRESTPSLDLVETKETGFTLSINNSDEKYNTSYHTAIRNIFSIIPNITKILLHNRDISESIWTCFYQFLRTSETLQELTIDCRLTIEQTKELSASLSDNKTLKKLNMFHIWEPNDEFDGFQEIFPILQTNVVLSEFILTCHTDLLQLDFIAKCLLKNKSLRILRLPKCEIHQNTDIELCESFLRNTSIHTLSLELISTDCEASLERLACAMGKNEIIETLELKGSNSSAIFHRKDLIPDSENSSVCLSPADTSIEPFYTLCDHAPFYKQVQEVTKNFKLEELQVTIGDHVEMRDITLSIKSNLTVTELRISRRILTVEDIKMLVEALRNNTTITHLNLNEINISIIYFRDIFGVLRDDRTLRVLEVRHCISHSDGDLFKKEIKTLEINNPSLKIVYENE